MWRYYVLEVPSDLVFAVLSWSFRGGQCQCLGSDVSAVRDVPSGDNRLRLVVLGACSVLLMYPEKFLSLVCLQGAVGCAVITPSIALSLHPSPFMASPLHDFADALRPRTPRSCGPGGPPTRPELRSTQPADGRSPGSGFF